MHESQLATAHDLALLVDAVDEYRRACEREASKTAWGRASARLYAARQLALRPWPPREAAWTDAEPLRPWPRNPHQTDAEQTDAEELRAIYHAIATILGRLSAVAISLDLTPQQALQPIEAHLQYLKALESDAATDEAMAATLEERIASEAPRTPIAEVAHELGSADLIDESDPRMLDLVEIMRDVEGAPAKTIGVVVSKYETAALVEIVNGEDSRFIDQLVSVAYEDLRVVEGGVEEGFRYIEANPEVKGGAPVIRGTRITTSAVLARLEGGDTLEDLIADYRYVNPDALIAAAAWERECPSPPPRPPRPPRPDARSRHG